jgi:hypothetical protein
MPFQRRFTDRFVLDIGTYRWWGAVRKDVHDVAKEIEKLWKAIETRQSDSVTPTLSILGVSGRRPHAPLDNPSDEEIVAEFMAEQEAWRPSDDAANVPEGNVHLVELLTTGNTEAVPVPGNVFDGPRDRGADVERVPR